MNRSVFAKRVAFLFVSCKVLDSNFRHKKYDVLSYFLALYYVSSYFLLRIFSSDTGASIDHTLMLGQNGAGTPSSSGNSG